MQPTTQYTPMIEVPRMVKAISTVALTPAQFDQFAVEMAPYRFELTAQGTLHMLDNPEPNTNEFSIEVSHDVVSWKRGGHGGKALAESGQTELPDHSVRIADVAWISVERWENRIQTEGRLIPIVTPDFVVEVVSPTDNLADQRAKMDMWMRNGVRLGWLIEPRLRTVWVYREGVPGYETLFQPTDDTPLVLSGETVMPGLEVPVWNYWRHFLRTEPGSEQAENRNS